MHVQKTYILIYLKIVEKYIESKIILKQKSNRKVMFYYWGKIPVCSCLKISLTEGTSWKILNIMNIKYGYKKHAWENMINSSHVCSDINKIINKINGWKLSKCLPYWWWSFKSTEDVGQIMFVTHVALGAEVIISAVFTLPMNSNNPVLFAPITAVVWVFNPWKEISKRIAWVYYQTNWRLTYVDSYLLTVNSNDNIAIPAGALSQTRRSYAFWYPTR